MPEPYNPPTLEAQRLMRQIRDLVNKERQHKNISFKEIAYRCRVSENTIMDALSHPKHLTIAGLVRIMSAVEVHVEIKAMER